MSKDPTPSPEAAERDEPSLRPSPKRSSAERIRDYIMRGGGEPFGRPFQVHTPSLTERAVKFFKQRSFFGFETLEKPQNGPRANKFTRYGASRYRGPHKKDNSEP